MPEGDTIFRAAASIRQWIGGRTITAARTTTTAAVQRLVGETIEEVEARGKHLLIRCTGSVTLHTHMRMTGSWHVYRAGEPWRRPIAQARVVIECGDRLAVCFNAPIIEVIDRRAEDLHPSVGRLGPDVLKPPVDLTEVRRRARGTDARRAIADMLLDQSIVAGIGNIWRAETLFLERVHPATPLGEIDDDTLDRVTTTAARLMTASVEKTRPQEPWVYRRTARPCKRCRTPITSARFENGRRVYWCPSCQTR